MTQPVPDNEAVRQPTPEQKVLAAQSQALARALQMLRQEYQSLLCELGELIDGLTQWQGEVEGDEATVKQVLSAPGTGKVLGEPDRTLLDVAVDRYLDVLLEDRGASPTPLEPSRE